MIVELAGIELYGYHGVLERERQDGQRFVYDLELEYGEGREPRSDRIEDALDYRDAVTALRAVHESGPFDLLETLADAVATALLELPVARVRVRVRKPDVDLGVPLDHSAVVVERRATAA